MQAPHPKTPDDLAPDFLLEAIRNRCRSYHGTKVTKQQPYHDCDGMNFRKHDWRERRFAILITETDFEELFVKYRRYWCKDCEKPVPADISGLYYEGCHYGRPIVDLCLYLATDNTFHAVERHLQPIGLQVDKPGPRREPG